MKNTIQTVLIAVILLAGIALAIGKFMEKPDTHGPNLLPEQVVTGPLKDTQVRFDGYYRNQVGNLLYLIRFFPEGRVVSVNGTTEVEEGLEKYLVRETKGNPSLGLHNVPVQIEDDSIFYVTHPEKGEIEYRGKVESGSMVRFLRHSHITGTKQMMEYIFYPDTNEVSQ